MRRRRESQSRRENSDSVGGRDGDGGDSGDLSLSVDPGKVNAELEKIIRDALEGHWTERERK